MRRFSTLLLLAVATSFGQPLIAAPAHAQNELGLNVHQSTDIGLDVTRDAGLGWVRIDFNWFNAQPNPGPPDFTFFDTLVDEALARNLQVLAVVGYGPDWASSGDGLGDGSHNDVPQPGTYEVFVAEVVQHFAGRITHYELWNEPNLGDFFEGTPDDYTSLILVPGATAVHAGCAQCKVVAPGLASIGGEYDIWLDASLTAAKDQIDIVSGHIYSGFSDAQTSDNFWNKLEDHRVIDINGTVVFEGPLSFREVMDQHGVDVPFWLTETGKQAAPGNADELEEQRIYYRKVLEQQMSRPWWEATIFYEGFDNTDLFWGVAWPDAGAPDGYQAKPVMGLLQKVTRDATAFGGDGFDCDDGLDNEGDGLVDFPEDPDCVSATGSSEGEAPVGGGGAGGAASTGGGGGQGAEGGASPGGAGSGESDDGCGCRAAGKAGPRTSAWWLMLLGAAVPVWRRRRAR